MVLGGGEQKVALIHDGPVADEVGGWVALLVVGAEGAPAGVRRRMADEPVAMEAGPGPSGHEGVDLSVGPDAIPEMKAMIDRG
jgi:hypothetical protein